MDQLGNGDLIRVNKKVQITDDVALVTVAEFTEHTRSNVCISAFITCYAH